MPYRLAGFADEISSDIQVQMDVLLDCGVRFNALRSANAKNVLELEEFQIKLTKEQFDHRGVRFASIGSPIGKVPIGKPFEPELERFRTACRRAKQFETKVIRVFAFRLPEGEDPKQFRDEVLSRMKKLAEHAAGEGLNLLLENHGGTYADTAERTADVLQGAGAKNLKCAFDFANMRAAGDDPLAAWAGLKPWVKDFHIKDRNAQGQTVPAGQGEGKIREILSDAFQNQWAGLLTLEPHLGKTPGFEEKSGGERFKAAAQALQTILKEINAK